MCPWWMLMCLKIFHYLGMFCDIFRWSWIHEGIPFYLTLDFSLHESHLKIITSPIGLHLPAIKPTIHYRAMILYYLYLFGKVIVKPSPKSGKPWRLEGSGTAYSKPWKKKRLLTKSPICSKTILQKWKKKLQHFQKNKNRFTTSRSTLQVILKKVRW